MLMPERVRICKKGRGSVLGKESLLTLYSDIYTKPVNWVWYPYIAAGKLTLLQGDPGDGKSSMMMYLTAELSTGGTMPDGFSLGQPQRVIYQCSEDGAGDTIKPRLVRLGANCRNVAFINEENHGDLTLDDERLRDAIIEFRPKLLVIDPVQAYIGNDSDLQMAGRARKLMRKLSIWAETYDCAVVLIGHMNKHVGTKDLYRGLGSIDLIAVARSVLQVERDLEDPDVRIVTQLKNSLETAGKDIRFEIRPGTGFRWLECTSPSKTESLEGKEPAESKYEKTARIIAEMLREQDIASQKVYEMLAVYGIRKKMAYAVKKELGIKAYRKNSTWYWTMKTRGHTGEKQ